MDTLFLGATLVIGLFESHGCRFDVFDPDRYRLACCLYIALINIIRYVVPPKVFKRHHFELTLFQSRCIRALLLCQLDIKEERVIHYHRLQLRLPGTCKRLLSAFPIVHSPHFAVVKGLSDATTVAIATIATSYITSCSLINMTLHDIN